MSGAVENIRARLFEMQDSPYRAFHSRLMPTVEGERVIGVRVPLLRAYARELRGSADAAEFMADLPHLYYEENNLHAFLIEGIRDYDACLAALESFLPCVDNWATCDGMSPKALKQDLGRTLERAKAWMASGHCYTVRYGVVTLMRFFLDEAFEPAHLSLVASVRSDEYYVNMARAWYFATALAKQYAATLPFIVEGRLDEWTHNRTIQKAVESDRISGAQKDFLKEYRKSGRKGS